MKRKYLVLITLALLCGTGCAQKSNNTASGDTFPLPEEARVLKVNGKRGGHLVLALSSHPKTFNPLLADEVENTTLIYQLYPGLMTYNYETFQTELDLAKSLDISEDGLQYTLTLRKGLKWSDGVPFTLEDYLFAYQVLTDPLVIAGAKDSIQQSDGSFPKLEKLSEDTLRFTLSEINPVFVASLWDIKPLPRHTLEAIYKKGDFMKALSVNEDPKNMPVLGPFMIEKFIPDQRLVMVRNPYYHTVDKNGVRLPYYDKVTRVFVPDRNGLLVKFQNGESDMHEVKPEEYDLLKKGEGAGDYKVWDLGPSFTSYYLSVNQNMGHNSAGKPYLSPEKKRLYTDKRFRQALSYAIDREGIVKTVFQGRGSPLTSFVTPADKLWANPNPKKYPYSIQKASELLDKIGIKDSDGDGLREYENGLPVRFVIKTNVENNPRVQMGNLIKQDLRRIGLDASLLPIPGNSLADVIKETRDYDAFMMGWATGIPTDPAMSKNITTSSGRSHYWNLFSPELFPWEKEMDDLVVKNQQSLNLRQRQKYWRDYLAIWEEELPQIMIATPNFYVGVKNKIGNVKPSALPPYYQWNIEELYDKSL